MEAEEQYVERERDVSSGVLEAGGGGRGSKGAREHRFGESRVSRIDEDDCNHVGERAIVNSHLKQDRIGFLFCRFSNQRTNWTRERVYSGLQSVRLDGSIRICTGHPRGQIYLKDRGSSSCP